MNFLIIREGGKPSVPSVRGALGPAQIRARAPPSPSRAKCGQRQRAAGGTGSLPPPLGLAAAQVKEREGDSEPHPAGSRRVSAPVHPPAQPVAAPSAPIRPGARGAQASRHSAPRERTPAPAGSGAGRPRAPGLHGRGRQVSEWPPSSARGLADPPSPHVCLSSSLVYDSSSARPPRSLQPVW